MSYPSKTDNPFVQLILKESMKEFHLLSPDGFTLSPDNKLYKSLEDAYQDFENWKQRYTKQGYYSSNLNGKIKLEYLWSFMVLHTSPFYDVMSEDHYEFSENWFDNQPNLNDNQWWLW